MIQFNPKIWKNAKIFKQFYCGLAGDPQEKPSRAFNRFIV